MLRTTTMANARRDAITRASEQTNKQTDRPTNQPTIQDKKKALFRANKSFSTYTCTLLFYNV